MVSNMHHMEWLVSGEEWRSANAIVGAHHCLWSGSFVADIIYVPWKWFRFTLGSRVGDGGVVKNAASAYIASA
jgi:hypothetical protein